MGRSFLSFAVVLGGLDLPVGIGNTVFHECFIGGLDTVVSCTWCIVCVCKHHPPLAVRYYEL